MFSRQFWKSFALSAIAFVWAILSLLSCVGCARSAPHAIVLPTTAAVRAPLVAARAHVARSVQLGRQEDVLAKAAVSRGIVAGSEEARQLSTLVAQDQAEKLAGQNQLTDALYQVGSLQKELDARQAKIDALARDDVAKTAQVQTVKRSRWRWRWALLILLVADYLCGAPIQTGMHTLVSMAVLAVLGGTKWFLELFKFAPLAACL